jgi:hypothetical protein
VIETLLDGHASVRHAEGMLLPPGRHT